MPEFDEPDGPGPIIVAISVVTADDVEHDTRDALRIELAWLKAEMAAAEAAAAEHADQQAATPRPIQAFRRVTQADWVPALNLGRPGPHWGGGGRALVCERQSRSRSNVG